MLSNLFLLVIICFCLSLHARLFRSNYKTGKFLSGGLHLVSMFYAQCILKRNFQKRNSYLFAPVGVGIMGVSVALTFFITIVETFGCPNLVWLAIFRHVYNEDFRKNAMFRQICSRCGCSKRSVRTGNYTVSTGGSRFIRICSNRNLEIDLHPKSSPNHISIPAMLFCTLNSNFI